MNYEKQILNHLLFCQPKETAEVFSTVSVEDFTQYKLYAEQIYKAWQEGETPTNRLSAEGYKVSEIMDDSFLTFKDLQKVTRKLKEQSHKKQVKRILKGTLDILDQTELETTLPELQQKLLGLYVDTKPQDAGIDSIVEEFEADREIYEEKRKNGIDLIGVSTGIKKLDEIIDGLRGGHLWVFGGYTNTGKTFGALNIAANLAKNKERTVLFSLEMSRTDILARLIGILSSQNSTKIKKGDDDRGKTEEALEIVRDSNFSCYSGNNDKDIATIVNTIHAECVQNKPALVIIDFVQLIQCKDARSEYETMTMAALALQTAAQKFDVPIMVLSQVSNEAAKTDNQQVMGFKGSGGIASAADLAIELVSGEDSTKELLEKLKKGDPVNINWRIKKNRHGRIGTIEMTFTGITGQFKDAYEF